MKLVAVAMTTWMLVFAGCSKGDSQSTGTYTVRGIVKNTNSSGAGDITIHHESIPDFVDREGNESGMMSMTMPFGLQKGVDMTGIEPGDKIEFTFEMHWKARPPSQIKSIKELPSDTELNLSGM